MRGTSALMPLLYKHAFLMRVLNLYAGIGGNRKLWTDCDVVAVELDEETASVYQKYFPEDEVIVGDAHDFLLENYKEFDFIWASPPCGSHSRLRMIDADGVQKQYPDLRLYQEVIFLDKFFGGKWVVENVIPYYEPIIPAQKIGRHLFWANFKLGYFEPPKGTHITASRTSKYNKRQHYEKFYGFDLKDYDLPAKTKRQILVNCVHPETGLYVFNRAKGIFEQKSKVQKSMFV